MMKINEWIGGVSSAPQTAIFRTTPIYKFATTIVFRIASTSFSINVQPDDTDDMLLNHACNQIEASLAGRFNASIGQDDQGLYLQVRSLTGDDPFVASASEQVTVTINHAYGARHWNNAKNWLLGEVPTQAHHVYFTERATTDCLFANEAICGVIEFRSGFNHRFGCDGEEAKDAGTDGFVEIDAEHIIANGTGAIDVGRQIRLRSTGKGSFIQKDSGDRKWNRPIEISGNFRRVDIESCDLVACHPVSIGELFVRSKTLKCFGAFKATRGSAVASAQCDGGNATFLTPPHKLTALNRSTVKIEGYGDCLDIKIRDSVVNYDAVGSIGRNGPVQISGDSIMTVGGTQTLSAGEIHIQGAARFVDAGNRIPNLVIRATESPVFGDNTHWERKAIREE